MTDRYGVTWATPDHSYAQTGYDFTDVESAKQVAVAGPWTYPNQVDAMCNHYPAKEWPLFARVETEDDSVIEVEVKRET